MNLEFVDIDIAAQTYSVIEYVTAMQRNEITVNHEYQRSPAVWPITARSFLIETIILGYPMPKLTLRQVTDVPSGRFFKEIVDGQQRSEAIRLFFENNLVLSGQLQTEDLRGRSLSELDPQWQRRFFDYRLGCDTFLGVEPAEVRETFRRMNSYTVPLNPEEHRHAVYQGPFKWFINRLGKRYDEEFVECGLFRVNQLIRMADTKLLTEICHAILNGIKTTNRKALDGIYAKFDTEFPEQPLFEEALVYAIDQYLSWRDIWDTAIVKPFMAYSLLLALIWLRFDFPTLDPGVAKLTDRPGDNALTNLSRLAAAYDRRDDYEEPGTDASTDDDAIEDDEADLTAIEWALKSFVDASVTGTNVRRERQVRFEWFCRAITDQMNAPISNA